MSWLVWAIVLLIQAASFTWVSRARNSKSVWYHAVASTCSNGIWFFGQVVVISKVTDAIVMRNIPLILFTAGFYTFFCVVGGIATHHYLMTRVETGNRKIG